MNVSTVQTAKISRKHTTSKRQEKQYEGFLPGDRKLFFQHMYNVDQLRMRLA